MKKYYLFGEDACMIYDDATVDGAKPTPLEIDLMLGYGFNVIAFDNPCDPLEVLSEYDGWAGWTQISEEEFNYLNSFLQDDSDEFDTITELCPHCEEEVQIKNEFTAQSCPNCTNRILPCSICDAINDSVPKPKINCNKCPLET